MLTALLTLVLAFPGLRASAAAPSPCSAINDTSLLVFHLAPLEEDRGGFTVERPGSLTDEHRAQIGALLDRAQCMLTARGQSWTALRITVLATTDDREARRAWRDLLKQRRIDDADAQVVADILINYVASNVRQRVVAEELREQLLQRIAASPQFAGGPPAQARHLAETIVPVRLVAEDIAPIADERLPRDFEVVVEVAPPGPPVTVEEPPHERSAAPQPPSTPEPVRAGEHEPDPPETRAILLELGAAYLHAFARSHIGPVFTFAWRSDWTLRSADPEGRGGFMFGARTSLLFGDGAQSYRIAPTLSSRALPALQAYVAVWGRRAFVEGRFAMALGGILPAGGALLQVEPAASFHLPAAFQLTLAGSVGGLLSAPRSTLAWGVTACLGRSF